MTPFLDGRVVLHEGDCLDVLASMDEASVDSCVCDPPYHLTSIVKRFGADGSAPAKTGKTGAYARASTGFMGKKWDGGDVAFKPETWAAVMRVLKPGAYLVAFSGTRTYHRMVTAIEDAGFDVRDRILDIVAGDAAVRRFVETLSIAQLEAFFRCIEESQFGGELDWIFGSGFPKNKDLGNGWGTALKPGHEPICLARKPLIGTNAENIAEFGTGGLNIDGCRISAGTDYAEKCASVVGLDSDRTAGIYGPMTGSRSDSFSPNGRWPANIIHDGSEEVVGAFPESGGGSASGYDFEASGNSNPTHVVRNIKSGVHFGDSGSAARFFYAVEKETRCDLCRVLLSGKNGRHDACDANTAIPSSATPGTPTGSTAHCDAAGSPPPGSEGRKQPSSGPALAAENRSDQCHPQSGNTAPSDALTQETSRIALSVRSAASLCASCETDIAQSLAATRLGLDPASLPCLESMPARRRQILLQHLALYVAGRESTDTITTTASLKTLFGSVLHAIADTTSLVRPEGPESTESARRLFYSSKADAEDRIGSKHPTVKPLDLMQYLVRLVTPTGGLVLDPFAGTGTTGEAAWREGMRAVLIEREAEYQADIARRMELAENPTKRAAVAKSKNNLQGAEGTPLFGGEAA